MPKVPIAIWWFYSRNNKYSYRKVFFSVNEPTCSKNSVKPFTIQHILASQREFSQHSGGACETGLSNFHKLTFSFENLTCQTESYNRSYKDSKYFNNELFRKDISRELSFESTRPNEFDELRFITSNILNSHALLKEKHIRCNPVAYMNNESSKTMLRWTCPEKKFGKCNYPEHHSPYKMQCKYDDKYPWRSDL